jgi:hypothetical protein
MKWRARSVVIAVYAVIIAIAVAFGPSVFSRPIGPVALVLALGAIWGAFFAATSIWFRCPHCHARQIRGRWDWFLVRDRCRECNQPLNGPALSREQLDAEAERELDAIDPGRKARWEEEAAARDAEKQRLWQQAPTDIRAAQQLRHLLNEEYNLLVTFRQRVERDQGAEPESVAQLEADQAHARSNLDRVETLIRSLKP